MLVATTGRCFVFTVRGHAISQVGKQSPFPTEGKELGFCMVLFGRACGRTVVRTMGTGVRCSAVDQIGLTGGKSAGHMGLECHHAWLAGRKLSS